MRIANGDGTPLDAVFLALSDVEAAELAQALEALRSAKAGWHEHVTDTDRGREITVYREDDESAVF